MIKVRWTLMKPPLKPAGWHRWQKRAGTQPSKIARGGRSGGEEHEIEDGLGWPHGTLQVLMEGFELKLSRQTGWSESVSVEGSAALLTGSPVIGLENSSPAQMSPVQAAAGVFKRGVAYAHQEDSGFRAQTHTGAYDIPLLAESASPMEQGDDLWTVVDGQVARHWPQMFSQIAPLVLTLNERTKSLVSVGTILKAWRDRGQPRRWQIVGGGLLSDVAAFAAALAGVEFDLVPTTLLAMVDACVGGKTGVNFPPYGKNQVGAWAFPREVRVWSPWLSTLPVRELRAGAVEALKHAFLLGDLSLARDLASWVEKKTARAMGALLEPLINCKATIVERDPAEEGERAVLNLGHTLGHALEGYALERSQDDYGILHGEAVAFGLVYAFMLSKRVAGLSPQTCDQMTALVHQTSGSLTRLSLLRALCEPDLTAKHVFERLLYFMGMDKKNIRGAETHWVLLSDLGQVSRNGAAWTTPVPLMVLREVWTDFIASLPEK